MTLNAFSNTFILMCATKNNFSCLAFLNNKWMPKKSPFRTDLLPVTLTQWDAQDNKWTLYFQNAKQSTYLWVIAHIHNNQKNEKQKWKYCYGAQSTAILISVLWNTVSPRPRQQLFSYLALRAEGYPWTVERGIWILNSLRPMNLDS